jgi:hypothetical protein
MVKFIRLLLMGIGALTLLVGLLYLAGIRIVGPNGQPLLAVNTAGSSRHQPGWRRSDQQASRDMGYMALANQVAPGSSQGGGGADQQGRSRRQNDARGNGQRGSQPGFGPTGGILLPIKISSTATPVLVGGKEKASFVGKDLTDNVEDTVIATAEGPRKGWSVAKTLKYLGVDQFKEAVFIGADGKKTVASLQQLQNQQTIPLFTYNENGQLMVVSGPKVRGTNKGKITLEEVKQIVAGRTDLLHVNGIQKIEVSG